MVRQSAWGVRDTTRVAAFAARNAVLGVAGAIPLVGGALAINQPTLGNDTFSRINAGGLSGRR